MSISLVSYPVVVESGIIKNIFPGFKPVELEFQRTDLVINSVGSGIDGQIAINVSGDLTSVLNVGEWVYLYAVGSSYTYDLSGKIVSIAYGAPNSVITINKPYIQASTDGYINYKQNWFLECKLVNIDDNNILQYPSLLSNDGTASGIVKVNTSILVDFLRQEILEKSGEVTNSRSKCKVMYREVWRENQTNVFTLVDETPLMITYAADDSNPEQFVNKFDIPKIWAGYPFNLALLHSVENLDDIRLSVEFDELDINQDDITLNNPLANFAPADEGFLQVAFNNNEKVIEDNTRYIRFNVNSNEKSDYETGDYDDNDYLTINTP